MPKDKPGTCTICYRHYAYLWDHVKKNHLGDCPSLPVLARMGYTACPSCGQPCQTPHGVLSHQARSGCNRTRSIPPDSTTPNSATPNPTTLDPATSYNLGTRNARVPHNGENPASALPARPATLLAGSRKNNTRRRTSQSPPVARERARPRARNIHTYREPPATAREQAIRLLNSLQPQTNQHGWELDQHNLEQDQDDLQQDRDSLQQDHNDLQQDHNNLQQDYDDLQPQQHTSPLGSSYGSPNDSTIGLIEDLLPSPHTTTLDRQLLDNSSAPSSPAESGIVLYAESNNQTYEARNDPHHDDITFGRVLPLAYALSYPPRASNPVAKDIR
jgi:hypothetical protein